MKVMIRGHQTSVQPRWRDHIYNRTAKLDRFEDRIIRLEIILAASHHHLKGNEGCKINAKVPRQTIAISKKDETMIEAIDASFKILERKIHNLWKDVKIRNRHDKMARIAKRGGF